jgi:hypothetical protein
MSADDDEFPGEEVVTRTRAMRSTIQGETPISPISKRINKTRDRSTQDLAYQELLTRRAANGGKAVYKDIQTIVNQYQSRGHKCVTRHSLNYRLLLKKEGKLSLKPVGNNAPPVRSVNIAAEDSQLSSLSSLTPHHPPDDQNVIVVQQVVVVVQEQQSLTSLDEEETTSEKASGGRRKGTTIKSKSDYLLLVKKSITMAAEKFLVQKTEAQKSGKNVRRGTLAKIIKDIESSAGLKPRTIMEETVISRVKRLNIEGISHQRISPLHEVEPLLVEWLIRLARMGEALTKFETMDLMDDLIRDSPHAERFIAFCKKRKINKDNIERIVGNKWYKLFMERYKDHLRRGKCLVQDSKRRTWCTYEKFATMYEEVYNSMVDCGVAEKLDDEVMYDKEGRRVFDPALMYGRPTKYRMLKPERCLFVDEVGCNTNQKDDGHVGGEKFVLARDQTESGCIGTNTDIHFTVLAFTAGTGEAVMCALILKSEKDITQVPLTWKMGIDITKNINTGETRAELFENNCNNGEEGGGVGAMVGGPKCRFNGKDLPCFVCCTPKASITSELLVEMMRVIEDSGAFPRSPELGVPFMLLDGHHSRTRLPFLNWINDPEHPWKVCIGVPYATHIWQPADSSELNGSFKSALTKVKRQYLRFKPEQARRFAPTDIVPILNMAWEKSLGRPDLASKAIIERGWRTLNYILLDSPKLICRSGDSSPSGNHTNIIISSNGTATSTSTRGIQCSLDLSTINIHGNIASSKLNMLINDEAKSEGRKRQYEEYKAMSDMKQAKIDRLNKMLGVSSANLAAAAVYTLGTDVADILRVKDKEETLKKLNTMNRKQAMETKQDERFLTAARKYKNKTTPLNYTDMKALLKKASKPDESPLKSKIAELTEQYHRRNHHIKKMFLAFIDEEVNESEQTPPEIGEEIHFAADAVLVLPLCTTGTDASTSTSLTAEI